MDNNSLKKLPISKNIIGESFQFYCEINDKNFQIRCTPENKSFQPLCNVVETSYLYNPIKLLNSVLNQHGQSFEGEVSFAYYHDYPDELEPGVNIYYFDKEFVVSEEQFKVFVIEFVNYSLKAVSELALESNINKDEIAILIEKLNN